MVIPRDVEGGPERNAFLFPSDHVPYGDLTPGSTVVAFLTRIECSYYR